jgi:DeoR/GlpR family transcriptional regulator of sugar metabolism
VFLLHVNYYNLVELVNARGSVRNVDLVDLLGVTEPTIRKDMTVLEKQGVLKRTHGGASAEKCRGKRSHRKACVQEIHDGDAVFLDSGTTNLKIACKIRIGNGSVSLCVKSSCTKKHPLAQQVKVGTSIHLSLDTLELIDFPLRLPVAILHC